MSVSPTLRRTDFLVIFPPLRLVIWHSSLFLPLMKPWVGGVTVHECNESPEMFYPGPQLLGWMTENFLIVYVVQLFSVHISLCFPS